MISLFLMIVAALALLVLVFFIGAAIYELSTRRKAPVDHDRFRSKDWKAHDS